MNKYLRSLKPYQRNWWLTVPILYYGVILALHSFFRIFRYQHNFDMDQYWPISIILFRPPQIIDLLTLTGLMLIWWSFLKFWPHMSIYKLLIWIGLFMLATNVLQGINAGFIEPNAAQDPGFTHYLQDAQAIDTPSNLLRYFEQIMPQLRDHPRVHPPGALLWFWITDKLLENPVAIALVTSSFSLLSLWCLYQIVNKYLDHQIALITTALWGLSPTFLIYFGFNFDAMIVACFALTMWLYINHSRPIYLTLAGIFLSISLFVSYAAIWLSGCLLIWQWWQYKNIKPWLLLMTITAGIYWLLYYITGFNYLQSLLLASSFEGPQGFYPIVAPVSYSLTRLEDILEPTVFIGPYLTALLGLSLYHGKHYLAHPLWQLGLSGLVAFILFLLTGAYYTGETARAAAYIYISLFILIAFSLKATQPNQFQTKLLLTTTFTLTCIMQLIAWYGW